MTFTTDGYEVCSRIVDTDRIHAIRQKMVAIMAPHCDSATDQPDSLDRCFYAIAAQGQELKTNVYRLFGRLGDLPLLLADKGVSEKVAGYGFTNYTIQAYSVFCLEPGNSKHMFLPHQDLRDRTSRKSLIVWVPLSGGSNCGGLALYPGTHRRGPLKHGLSPSGQLMLEENAYADSERLDVTEFDVGDCVFVDPYLVHESIENRGEGIRWTAVIKIDDASGQAHVRDSIHPFDIEEYIDARSNAERLG